MRSARRISARRPRGQGPRVVIRRRRDGGRVLVEAAVSGELRLGCCIFIAHGSYSYTVRKIHSIHTTSVWPSDAHAAV